MEDDKVLDFISRRFPKDCNWLGGNCLWFSLMLKRRFPSSEIYYLPIEGHFVVSYGGSYYDWTGRVELKEKPILLYDLKAEDPLVYSRLIRDCFI